MKMKLKDAEAIIEGILFAAGEPVDVERISNILDIDIKSTRALLTALSDKYDEGHRGLRIIRLEDSYQMCTRGEYSEYISRLAEPRRAQTLSNAAMEVLSIVAYKQPVTRSVIEQIRGVSCDALVNRLLERNLIQEVGRLDTPGRPMLFGTNDEFLRCFGISSIADLPDYEIISSDQVSLEGEDGYMSVIDERAEEESAVAFLNAEGPDVK